MNFVVEDGWYLQVHPLPKNPTYSFMNYCHEWLKLGRKKDLVTATLLLYSPPLPNKKKRKENNVEMMLVTLHRGLQLVLSVTKWVHMDINEKHTMQARLHSPWEQESKTESFIIFSLSTSVSIWGLWLSPPPKVVRCHVDKYLTPIWWWDMIPTPSCQLTMTRRHRQRNISCKPRWRGWVCGNLVIDGSVIIPR